MIVKQFLNIPTDHSHLTLYDTIPTFNDLTEEAFENIMEKGENAGI